MPARVSLIRGEDRRANLLAALDALDEQIDLAGKRHVLIKPNLVEVDRPLATTHAGATRAVLEFIRRRYDGPISIAEGPAIQPAAEAFARYGYEELAREYEADLVDLNRDETVGVDVFDWRLRPLHLQMARRVVESDFRISVGPLKTHNVVIVTLSIKNMVMGALISRLAHAPANDHHGRGMAFGQLGRRLKDMVPKWVRGLAPVEWAEFRAMRLVEPSDKIKMHQSYPVINLNLALLAPRVMPHLAVLDGYEAMEGNGPTDGTPVPLRAAVAGTDALAVDVVGAALMGFDARQVGYLHYCTLMGLGTANLDEIEMVGNATLEECRRPFQPHRRYRHQLKWRSRRAAACLGVTDER
ncbi:MAG: DUF362 domain-containing protein [Anaerolineae bacterium]|nr:DUF362 domain-containing protein [Anaerolineae bacterium]